MEVTAAGWEARQTDIRLQISLSERKEATWWFGSVPWVSYC